MAGCPAWHRLPIRKWRCPKPGLARQGEQQTGSQPGTEAQRDRGFHFPKIAAGRGASAAHPAKPRQEIPQAPAPARARPTGQKWQRLAAGSMGVLPTLPRTAPQSEPPGDAATASDRKPQPQPERPRDQAEETAREGAPAREREPGSPCRSSQRKVSSEASMPRARKSWRRRTTPDPKRPASARSSPLPATPAEGNRSSRTARDCPPNAEASPEK